MAVGSVFIESIVYCGAVVALTKRLISPSRLAEQGQEYGCEEGAGHSEVHLILKSPSVTPFFTTSQAANLNLLY